MDYFKDNPRIKCPKCPEGTLRIKGIDRNGNEREYTQCMNCTIREWKEKQLNGKNKTN
jgi:ssDNA-binding Zn-finger/Zn-ribbon topoisomerase 1